MLMSLTYEDDPESESVPVPDGRVRAPAARRGGGEAGGGGPRAMAARRRALRGGAARRATGARVQPGGGGGAVGDRAARLPDQQLGLGRRVRAPEGSLPAAGAGLA